jgi:hypothetical protein
MIASFRMAAKIAGFVPYRERKTNTTPSVGASMLAIAVGQIHIVA